VQRGGKTFKKSLYLLMYYMNRTGMIIAILKRGTYKCYFFLNIDK
jgi:hypothetical protein